MQFVGDGVDIVVADEDEANALFETDSFEDTLAALDGFSNLWVITRSDKGSVIVHGDERIEHAATPVTDIVDTTGAGDAYCAGFLFGWANDLSLEQCARYGTYCATTVIQQLGARIEPGLIDDLESH
jgi:sugar/nucleoside kinase (ribokinase family)